MRQTLRTASPLLALAACTPAPQPPSTSRAAVEAPLAATLDLAPDGRPQAIGRRWMQQRATLTLRGSQATLQIDSRWGVRDVRCPEEFRGTSMQGCGSDDDARALEARVEREGSTLRGEVAAVGARLSLTLRAGPNAPMVSLICQRADAGLTCVELRGWPVRDGFRPPAEVRFGE